MVLPTTLVQDVMLLSVAPMQRGKNRGLLSVVFERIDHKYPGSIVSNALPHGGFASE
jgi:hypothetical protein